MKIILMQESFFVQRMKGPKGGQIANDSVGRAFQNADQGREPREKSQEIAVHNGLSLWEACSGFWEYHGDHLSLVEDMKMENPKGLPHSSSIYWHLTRMMGSLWSNVATALAQNIATAFWKADGTKTLPSKLKQVALDFDRREQYPLGMSSAGQMGLDRSGEVKEA